MMDVNNRNEEDDPFVVELTEPLFENIEEAREYGQYERRRLYIRIGCSAVFVLAAIFAVFCFPKYAFWANLVLLVCGLLFLLCAWTLKQASFCPNCGVIVSNTFTGKLDRWCSGCGFLLKPNELRLKSTHLDLGIETISLEEDSSLKLIKVCMLFAIHEHADEAIFEVGEEYRLDLRVGEEIRELMPPPPAHYPQVFATAREMWREDSHSTESEPPVLDVQSELGSAKVTAEFSSHDLGETLTLRITYRVAEPAAT